MAETESSAPQKRTRKRSKPRGINAAVKAETVDMVKAAVDKSGRKSAGRPVGAKDGRKREFKVAAQNAGADPSKKFKGETPAQRAILPRRFKLPEMPVGKMTQDQQEDAKTTVVASLMRRGHSNAYRIQAVLGGGEPIASINKRMKKVLRRWSVESVTNPAQIKATQLSKYSLITEKLWEIYERSRSDVEKQALLKQILHVYDMENILHGFKAGASITINNNPSQSGGSVGSKEEIKASMDAREIADRFKQLISQRNQDHTDNKDGEIFGQ